MNSDQQQKIFEQVPVDYYNKGVKNNLFQKYWHNKKWRTLSKFINRDAGRLLDIGCADGTTTNQIKTFLPNCEISGIDLYKRTIDFAKKKYKGIEFTVADAHRLPFKNGSFDVVTAIEILEHLERPEDALGEIHRVLNKNGTLVVVQDTDSILFRLVWWFWNKSKGSVWQNSHISCVRPNGLVKMIKSAGFKVNKIHYTNLKMEVYVQAQKT